MVRARYTAFLALLVSLLLFGVAQAQARALNGPDPVHHAANHPATVVRGVHHPSQSSAARQTLSTRTVPARRLHYRRLSAA